MKVLDMFDDTGSNWDKRLSEREDSDKDVKKSEEPNGNNNDSRDQYVDPELQRTMSYAKSQFPSYKDPQLAFDKWVQNNINRSEERDLEHDEEIENLYRKLNQVTTDLQRIKELQRTAKLGEERQRLDPKCWKGYRKVGTKIKGGVRVNDCKKIGEGEDQVEAQGVAEGSEQVFKVVAVSKSNALEKPTTLNVKASSLDEVFERLAINDWYPLEINGVEVIAGKRLKKDLAEAKDLSAKISALEKKIDVKQGALEMAREKRKMSGKSKGVQSEREVKLGAEISNLRQELHILKNSQKDLVEDKDSFGYPAYTIDQLQRMFRNGTWEPMSDLKPNSHVQIRNTTTGGRKTVHVKPDNQVRPKTTTEETMSNSNFLWSKLDPGLTVEEKIIIAEKIALRKNLKESAKVEAWGYMYNNQDRRIVWRKVFPSGEAAYRWADQRNATVLGTRETEDSNTEPRKPLFKESTVSIRRTSKMSTLGERSQQYQLLDALGRNIAVFESARRAQHIYTALTRLREALEVSNANPTDRVTMDIPLLLRVLEYAKEDAKTDMDLHDVTENLIDLSKSGQALSMKDYESVVDISDRTPEPTNDRINEVGDRYWCKNERRWKDRS